MLQTAYAVKSAIFFPIHIEKKAYCGLVVGGFLGELASKVDFLWWVSYGEEFGISSPVTIDLSIIKLTIGFMFKINISSIIGLILAIFIYRKV